MAVRRKYRTQFDPMFVEFEPRDLIRASSEFLAPSIVSTAFIASTGLRERALVLEAFLPMLPAKLIVPATASVLRVSLVYSMAAFSSYAVMYFGRRRFAFAVVGDSLVQMRVGRFANMPVAVIARAPLAEVLAVDDDRRITFNGKRYSVVVTHRAVVARLLDDALRG